MNAGQSRDESSSEQPLSGWRRFMRILFVLQILLLFALALWTASSPGAWEVLRWKPDTSNWILQTAGQLGVFALRDFVLFGLLAFFAAAACSRADRNYGFIGLPFAVVLGFAWSTTIALLCKSLSVGFPLQPPSIVVMAFVGVTCLWGSWAGATWMRSQHMFGWAACQVLSLTILIGGLGFAVGWFGLESQPLEVTSVDVNTDDRRRLVKIVREHDPRDLEPNQTSQLTLSEHDMNQLLSMGLSMLPGSQEAKMYITADDVSLDFTFKLPAVPIFQDVLNVRLAGKAITQNGELGVEPHRIQVGRIVIPEPLLRFSGPIMIDQSWHNEGTRPFFSALRSLDVGNREVTVAYGHLELKEGFVRDALVGVGVLSDLGPATAAHVEVLLDLARANPSLTFGQCMEAAFAEARRRSESGDPVEENRAAVLALGYTLGHPRIKKFVGPELPAIPPDLVRKFRAVRLRQSR